MRRDRAFVEQEVNLYSASAKNLLSLIPSVSIALHKINFRRPDSQGRELQRVIDEEIIKPLAADLEAATACSIDDYQACCGECEVVYPASLKKTIKIFYPGVRSFLQLIYDFDKLMFWENRRWLTGLINDREFKEVRSSWRQRFLQARWQIREMAKTGQLLPPRKTTQKRAFSGDKGRNKPDTLKVV
ncbi:MAG: hypothetical protein JRG72_11855 [Deltaproteobacteria bacterium]|nr:hypothetical protein [Deltaproteobacteria bacterium]